MYKQKKHRNIQYKRIGILIGILILIIALVFGAFRIFRNPYKKYDTYNETTKNYGDLKHEKELEKENYYFSFYYPKYKEDALNKIVEQYKKDYISKKTDGKEMKIITVDYDSELIYDHYVSLTFHQTVQNEDNKILKKEDISYNYDLKRNKLLTVKNVLRRNFISMLEKEATKQGFKKEDIKLDSLNNFIVSNDKLSFYFNNDSSKLLTIDYKNHKPYIALTDKNIPSYFMKDPIEPAKQPKIDPNKKLIAFTFDDGPKPENTITIMNELEKYNGRGTFFMLGQNMDLYPDIVKEVYKRGHEVANHSWDHSQDIAFTGKMNAKEVTEEVYAPNDVVFKLTGFEPRYFRPPFGSINDTLNSVCGLDIVLWDIDSEDWSNHNANKMTQIIEDTAKYGAKVVLMHDIHADSVEGVKLILKKLHDKGYQFVTIDTLLQHEGKYLTSSNNVIPSKIGK